MSGVGWGMGMGSVERYWLAPKSILCSNELEWANVWPSLGQTTSKLAGLSWTVADCFDSLSINTRSQNQAARSVRQCTTLSDAWHTFLAHCRCSCPPRWHIELSHFLESGCLDSGGSKGGAAAGPRGAAAKGHSRRCRFWGSFGCFAQERGSQFLWMACLWLSCEFVIQAVLEDVVCMRRNKSAIPYRSKCLAAFGRGYRPCTNTAIEDKGFARGSGPRPAGTLYSIILFYIHCDLSLYKLIPIDTQSPWPADFHCAE